MSASAPSGPTLPRDQHLLGDLLHSLSQPLTSLWCSLELSFEDGTEKRQPAVSAALQQAETVIGLVQLMREYLDPEPLSRNCTAGLAPALQSVAEDLSSIAAVRGVCLRVAGTCAATLPVAQPQLRRALEYLILPLIARVPTESEIALDLREGPGGTELRAQNNHIFSTHEAGPANPRPKRDSAQETISRVRLAIGVRTLETAGATLSFEDDSPGFVLRIPLRRRHDRR